jgi:hypothetical protein
MLKLNRCGALALVTGLCLLAHNPVSHAENKPKDQREEKDATEIVAPGAIETLRTAQTIAIRTKTNFFQPSTLEQELLSREEFVKSGVQLTLDFKQTDLILEVTRKRFTTKFPYVVSDGHKGTILLSGIVNSVGGTVEGKIADRLSKQLSAARAPKPGE